MEQDKKWSLLLSGVLSEGYKCRAGSGRAEQGYVIVDMRFLAEGRVTMKTLETQMDTFLRDHFIHDTYISCYQLNCMVTFMDTKCHITLQPCGVWIWIHVHKPSSTQNKMETFVKNSYHFLFVSKTLD